MKFKSKVQFLYLCVFIVLLFLLNGCTGNLVKPIAENEKKAFENSESIAVVHYETGHPFMMWGAAGKMLVDWPEDLQKEYIDKDKQPSLGTLLKRNNITDPTIKLTQYFVEALKKKVPLKDVTIAEQAMEMPVKETYSHYKSQYKQDYIIEIQPERSLLGWGFAAQVFSPTTYKFNLTTNARIIRQSDSKEIWRGRCFSSGQFDDRLNVAIEDLLSKNNVKVQNVVEMGIRKCADILVNQYLGGTEIR